MEKDDAVRKVRSLQALADHPATSPVEAASARAVATRLQEKFGLTVEDLEEREEILFFGHRLFFFNEEIQPHLKRIQEEIDGALAKADRLDIQNKLDTYTRFYKELREMVEGTAYFDRLKQRRDVAVREYYQTEKEQYRATRREWDRKEGRVRDAVELAHEETYIHNHARDWTAIHGHLRKDTVERIVGVSEQALTIKAYNMYPCFFCGETGTVKNRIGLFTVPVEGDSHNREWAHQACAEAK